MHQRELVVWRRNNNPVIRRRCARRRAICHPASATLRREDGTTITIDKIQVGERIATPSGFETVVGLLHADPTKLETYHRITTAKGALSMAIHERHHLLVNGQVTSPEKVAVGDEVMTEWGVQTVESVKMTKEQGAYHVQTPSGFYYVDGIVATTYVDFVPYPVWRLFADGYIYLRYLIGIPIVPEGEGVLPIFAIFGVLDAMGVPHAVTTAAWPFTVLCVMMSEIFNKIVATVTSGGAAAALVPLGATAIATLKVAHAAKARASA